MVKINGEMLNIDGKTLSEYLSEANYDRLRVAVEINGNIIPRSCYEKTVFRAGDEVEVVNFVGGG